jgi:hypothetical protein
MNQNLGASGLERGGRPCAFPFHPCFARVCPMTSGALTHPAAIEPNAALLQARFAAVFTRSAAALVNFAAVLTNFAAIMATSAAALPFPAPIQPSSATVAPCFAAALGLSAATPQITLSTMAKYRSIEGSSAPSWCSRGRH